MNIQKLVSENIKARGYYEGHEPVPLLARHVAKLAEELYEIGETILMSGDSESLVYDFERALGWLGEQASSAFDAGDWKDALLFQDTDELKLELADLQVVILSMAQIINDNFGEYDVLQAALEKSQKDIERGVR